MLGLNEPHEIVLILFNNSCFRKVAFQHRRGWTNDEVRSGKIPLDDSRPFMAMNENSGTVSHGEVPAADDGERFDFTLAHYRLGRSSFKQSKS